MVCSAISLLEKNTELEERYPFKRICQRNIFFKHCSCRQNSILYVKRNSMFLQGILDILNQHYFFEKHRISQMKTVCLRHCTSLTDSCIFQRNTPNTNRTSAECCLHFSIWHCIALVQSMFHSWPMCFVHKALPWRNIATIEERCMFWMDIFYINLHYWREIYIFPQVFTFEKNRPCL